jgi:hypothetical protein
MVNVVQELTSTITGFVALLAAKVIASQRTQHWYNFARHFPTSKNARQPAPPKFAQHHPYHVGGTIQRGLVCFQTFSTSRLKEQMPSIRQCRRRIGPKQAQEQQQPKDSSQPTNGNAKPKWTHRQHADSNTITRKKSSSKQQPTHQQSFYTRAQSSLT